MVSIIETLSKVIFSIIGISLMIGLGATVLPIVLIIYLIRRLIKRGKKEKKKSYQMVELVPAEQKYKVNQMLKKHFQHADSFMIKGNVSIRPEHGTFSDLDHAILYYGDESISMISDLQYVSEDDYKRIYHDVLNAANQEAVVKHEVSKATEFIHSLKQMNQRIIDPNITKELDKTVELLQKIEIYEMKNSEATHKLNKLYDYYLPILLTILKKYDDLSYISTRSNEFIVCKSRLEKTISLINEALLTINEQISQGDFLDISTDITTLQSLLKKDGLVKEGQLEWPHDTTEIFEDLDKVGEEVAKEVEEGYE